MLRLNYYPPTISAPITNTVAVTLMPAISPVFKPVKYKISYNVINFLHYEVT